MEEPAPVEAQEPLQEEVAEEVEVAEEAEVAGEVHHPSRAPLQPLPQHNNHEK